MLEVLRIRDFRLLWGGGLVSALGSWLLTIAIPARVFLLTGSLRATGLTVAAEYLPLLLLGPVAGVFADRWDRRRLMITANLACAGAVAVMLLGTSPGRYWVLYAALIAENSGIVLYAPAWQARTPAIVGTGSLLSSANALNSASSGTVRLIGGPLGGFLLIEAGLKPLIAADALSYLLAAAAIFATSRTPEPAPAAPEPAPAAPAPAPAPGKITFGHVLRDLTEGARVLRRQPVARALLPVTVVFLAANACLSALLIPLGAPVIRRLLDRIQPRALLAASLTGVAGAFFALFTSSSLATALPAAVAVGTFGSMSLVIPQTTMQRVIPNAALGRVSAAFLTAEAAATLAGAAAGPFLAQAVHLTGLAAVAALLTLAAAALAGLTIPRLAATSPAPGAG